MVSDAIAGAAAAQERSRRARLIAFYLPQFHPIPENDRWWEPGFTEWTNVAKARPLFPGHAQPAVPADLGFYDLRVPEARAAQAGLARAHGVEAFCYWHYWFGNGRRILERPFQEVVASGEPDFPFCLAWANQTWTGIWHGAESRILAEQQYPGDADYRDHFYALLEAFGDDRYVRVDGRPLFVVFNPTGLPDRRRFTDLWRELAAREGLGGLYLVGIGGAGWDHRAAGFDGRTDHQPAGFIQRLTRGPFHRLSRRVGRRDLPDLLGRALRLPRIYSYEQMVRHAGLEGLTEPDHFPCVLPNWDNTPRSGRRGVVFAGATPERFRRHLADGLRAVQGRDPEHRLVFLKSWNEWAEGNYVEPDQRFGREYLEAMSAEILGDAGEPGRPARPGDVSPEQRLVLPG